MAPQQRKVLKLRVPPIIAITTMDASASERVRLVGSWFAKWMAQLLIKAPVLHFCHRPAEPKWRHDHLTQTLLVLVVALVGTIKSRVSVSKLRLLKWCVWKKSSGRQNATENLQTIAANWWDFEWFHLMLKINGYVGCFSDQISFHKWRRTINLSRIWICFVYAICIFKYSHPYNNTNN